MRTRLILVAIAGIAATEAALAQEMPWARSFDEAEKVAGQQKKLVMVDFYTDW